MTDCTTDTTGPEVDPGGAPPVISSLLLKVASRCNLACDYCYVYAHADQSWTHQPKFMSDDVIALAVERVREHAQRHKLDRVAIIFHGGEPLLVGAERLASIAMAFREGVPDVRVDFGLQTNGTLLTDNALDVLEAADIGVSLSIDGPRNATDRHRLTTGGRSSFDQTVDAAARLRARPHVYAGIIGVIDTANDPAELLDFYASLAPPQADLLLPDANHVRQPPGRDDDPDLYTRWLTGAFDVWFDRHPQLPMRTFEAILDGIVGLPSHTDALGFGDVSLLTIETDGSYHDLDVLKVTTEGASALGLHLKEASVDEAAATDKIAAHRALLRADGLSEECRSCAEVSICAGGAVPHRYDVDGFAHPSVYCHEMQALISHARRRLCETLTAQRDAEEVARSTPRAGVDLADFDVAESAAGPIGDLRARWMDEAEAALLGAADHACVLVQGTGDEPVVAAAAGSLRALGDDMRRELSVQPSVVVWAHVMCEDQQGRHVLDLAGRQLPRRPEHLVQLVERGPQLAALGMRWHPPDFWLRQPFEDGRVVFEDSVAAEARDLSAKAFELVARWRPALGREIELLSRDVLFIRDLTAHPDKVVSFSDDSVPGALYCSVRRSNNLISPLDLADSLIHEHRHQKLYLLDRYVPAVLRDRPLVRSPWREDPRPPSGLLHAVFVFVELIGFWRFISDTERGAVAERARAEVETIAGRLRAALATLRDVALTERGEQLVASLEARAAL
jgi:uncharacterized protein